MFFHISTHLITSLLIVNGVLILCFLFIHHYYDAIVAHIETLSVTSKNLDDKQKKILKRYFPFYNKLSHTLQRLFEQKLLFFYYTKEYISTGDLVVLDRMKLLISAYAAQVSLGFKDYGFSTIYRVNIYPVRFYSAKTGDLMCWELDDHGTLHLSWKDFFWQLRKEIVLPIGLEIMAFAIKKGESTIKEDIFHNRSLLYHHASAFNLRPKSTPLFCDADFKTKEDFLEACIKNYFGHPIELKNHHPDLFRKIDMLLYSQIRSN